MAQIVKNYKHEIYNISLGDKCIYKGKKYKVYGINEEFILINGYDDNYIPASSELCDGYVLSKAVKKGYSKWVDDIGSVYIIK